MGSAKTALMTTTGSQVRGLPQDRGRPHIHVRPAAQPSTIAGTTNRKAAWPWIRNQPDSGNAVIYTSADGTHPTQQGHWNLAYHIASELAKRFPELQPQSGRR